MWPRSSIYTVNIEEGLVLANAQRNIFLVMLYAAVSDSCIKNKTMELRCYGSREGGK